MRTRLAAVLDSIAQAEEFDTRKYKEFEELLRKVQIDKVIGAAADEITEYCLSSQPGRTILGRRTKLDVIELEGYRENLKLFAQAIRANITDFRSIQDLRKKVQGKPS